MRSRFVPVFASVAALFAVPAMSAPQLGNFQMIPGGTTARNLQVLSKDIKQGELDKLMERYSKELGVKCTFCHVQDAPEKDDRANKATSRRMMKMTADLNAKKADYFGPRAKANVVTCATCHRGKAKPDPLEN